MHLSKVVTIVACSFSALVASDVMADWREFNHDAQGTRNASEESCLTPKNVGSLKVKWSFATPAQVSGTPAVVSGHVYVGDFTGTVYSLDEHTGSLVWKTAVSSTVTASALVTDDRVVIGDLGGHIYGLDRKTGSIVWQFSPSPHPLAAIFGSGVKVGRYVAYGVSSNEEQAAANPQYPCCSFRGLVVMFDPENGQVVWQTATISDAQAAQGASGAAVWSTPTYDDDLGLLFVTTGNNYTAPTTPTGDAFVALDAKTGNIVWINQRTPDDSWNGRTPFGLGHDDFDFGDSPQVYELSNGHKVVGAGQKSGFYHVLDAATGAVVNFQQYQAGTSLGGLLADSAVGYGMVFAPSANWPINSTGSLGAPTTGDLVAISSDGSREIWRFAVPNTADIGGVAIANGVVYFSQAFSGNFYALDAFTGKPLATFAIGAGGSGPSVADGMVFVGTGNPFSAAAIPSSVTALGL
jgi:polyvinyl alcohol dehydrogenase (cytochrome)